MKLSRQEYRAYLQIKCMVCREWAHTNDVHSHMYFLQLCKALFSLAHWKRLSSSITRARTRLRQQCLSQDPIAPSSHEDRLCRPIVKEYLLLCQNVICCSIKSCVLQHKKRAAQSCLSTHTLAAHSLSSWVNNRQPQCFYKVCCFCLFCHLILFLLLSYTLFVRKPKGTWSSLFDLT